MKSVDDRQHHARVDIRFLRLVLMGLALTTCFLGAATVMAMS